MLEEYISNKYTKPPLFLLAIGDRRSTKDKSPDGTRRLSALAHLVVGKYPMNLDLQIQERYVTVRTLYMCGMDGAP